jgi:hypothetical protein
MRSFGMFSVLKSSAEAMIIDHTGDTAGGEKGDIYLITKNPKQRSHIRIAKIPVAIHADGNNIETPFPLINAGTPYRGRIWTSADMSPNGSIIAMRTGDDVYYFSRLVNQSVVDALAFDPCPYIAPTSRNLQDERQYEAVAFWGNDRIGEISECQDQAACEVPVYLYNLISPTMPLALTSQLTPAGSTTETITHDDFTSGWGNFVSGGSNAIIVDEPTAPCAPFAKKARIRDRNGVTSSFWHETSHECTAYDEIVVTFWYHGRDMEPLDSFFLEYSSDGGYHWMVAKEWTHDNMDAFVDNEHCYRAEARILSDEVGSFTDFVKFRFRSNAGKNDRVYLMDIHMIGIIYPY